MSMKNLIKRYHQWSLKNTLMGWWFSKATDVTGVDDPEEHKMEKGIVVHLKNDDLAGLYYLIYVIWKNNRSKIVSSCSKGWAYVDISRYSQEDILIWSSSS